MHVSQIRRHPIKSMTSQRIHRVNMVAGQPVPFDRIAAFAIESEDTSSVRSWAGKRNFVNLMQHAAFAAYCIRIESTGDFQLTHKEYEGEDPILSGNILLKTDASQLAAFFTHQLEDLKPKVGKLRFVETAGQHFCDEEENFVSICSLESVHALEEHMDAKNPPNIDIRRFRQNFWISADRPFHEFDLIGKCVQLGSAVFEVVKPIPRCAAITVEPTTGAKNIEITKSLVSLCKEYDDGRILKQLGKGAFMGVYARCITGGYVSDEDTVIVLN